MVRALFVDASWIGDATINRETIDYLKHERKAKKITLFAAVNFLKHLPYVKEQLENEGFEVLITKADRTLKIGQILGCDSYHHVFKDDIFGYSDIIVYLGDGMFHPEALVFAQMYSENFIDVLCWDPTQQEKKLLTIEQIERRKKKLKGNILRFLTAKTVGILVTAKPGQQYLQLGIDLKKKLKEQGKRAYVFVDDTFNFAKIEDYNDIEVWVNTACPRIGQDDVTAIPKPIINLREANDPGKYLERL